MVPLLCCHWDFSGIFLTVGVFARYCQIIWKSIVHERIVFQKVFFLFFAINNFQTIGGRVSLLSVALAAQGSEVPDLQLLTAFHWPSSSSHCISVGNWTGLLVTSNTFPKEVLGLRCLLAFHWHDLRWIFLLQCTVPAWGQFIRQGRSRCMLGEAGNSDDRQSLFHLPWLLANDVLFISRSAMKTPRRWLPSETCSITSSYLLRSIG